MHRPAGRLVPGVEYRLEGWVRSPTGKGRLGSVEDGQPRSRQAVAAPAVAAADQWRHRGGRVPRGESSRAGAIPDPRHE